MSSVSVDDANARERILDAAIDLIGTDGLRSATVRRVAERADVSAPLILHHFGSKAGLVAECDRIVMRRFEQTMEPLTASGPAAGMHAILTTDGMGAAITYVARSVQDGGAAGSAWFDNTMTMTTQMTDEMTARGQMRATPDPAMRAVLMLAMDFGVVFMRPLIERFLGASLTDPDVIDRWVRTEFDMLAHGVFNASVDTPSEPADEPTAEPTTKEPIQ